MRYIQRIETDDIKDSYAPESYINITLPNSIVDLHTFTLYYTGLPTSAFIGGVNTVKRFFPRLSQSIVSTLIIEVDGRQIQKIDEFGYLFNILHDISRDDQELNSTSFDTISKHNVSSATGIITKNIKLQAEYNPTNLSESFYIDKWLGFLNEGNRYLDCTNKNIKIRIKLAPASILYRGINNNGVNNPVTNFALNYTLSDVYATIDILDNMPEQPSSNTFTDYMTIVGFTKGNNKNTSVSFQCDKPINYLLGTFTSPSRIAENELLLSHCHSTEGTYGDLLTTALASVADYNTLKRHQHYYSYDVAKQLKLPYLLNNSIYFQRNGKGILNCVFNINGYNITPKLSLLACYKEAKKCFDTEYKRVISLASFENDFFCNAIKVEDNTFDVKRIEWNVETDPSKFSEGGQPIVFVCTEGSYY